MDQPFKALRIIGTIYKVLGIIVGVITILGALAICATSVLGGALLNNIGQSLGGSGGGSSIFGGIFGGLVGGLLSLIYGGGMAVTLYAAGEAVYLLLALEEHGRNTVALLTQQRKP